MTMTREKFDQFERAFDERDSAVAEVERLRAENESLRAQLERAGDSSAEVERLTKHIKGLEDLVRVKTDANDRLNRLKNELFAKVAKLEAEAARPAPDNAALKRCKELEERCSYLTNCFIKKRDEVKDLKRSHKAALAEANRAMAETLQALASALTITKIMAELPAGSSVTFTKASDQ